MQRWMKSRAEAQFAEARKKDRKVVAAKEKAQKERANHIADLRALRLAKEAADREAAEK